MERDVIEKFNNIKDELLKKSCVLAVTRKMVLVNRILEYKKSKKRLFDNIKTSTKVLMCGEILLITDIKTEDRGKFLLHQFTVLTEQGIPAVVYCEETKIQKNMGLIESNYTQTLMHFLNKLDFLEKVSE